ncbi:hypothetical protein JHK85_036847 [Glycine max]|nr:hypothetical protein JHK85_036847 [Glycine max]
MVPQDLSRANLLSALDGARVVYFDARMPDNALVIAQEPVTKLRAEGIEESVCGRLYYGTSEKIPPSELVDTTGAGDAFVGAVLYSICANLSLEKMLPFASYVVADDSQGRSILDELQADGVDTSFIVVSKEGISPFTYIIVDNQTKTRTCIHTAGYPPMIPDDLSKSSLLSALDGVKIAYFDGSLPDTALVVAQEASTIPQALVSMLLMLPNIKFVIVTLGKDVIFPPVPLIHPVNCKIEGRGDRNSSGKLYVETAESIPPLELVDTTGAGDAFIGAVIYAICAKITPETMISFAANVAGAKCRDLGARSGLPYRADPRIASFVLEKLISSA